VTDPYSRLNYRRLIAWPERIEREWPFFEKLLHKAPSNRLLDLGCGSGEHAQEKRRFETERLARWFEG